MTRFRFTAFASAAFALALAGGLALAQEEAEQPKPPRQEWSFAGVFGTFDQAQLQRGFQVYKEVCSNCHALTIPFRTLAEPGGPGFTEDQVKALAASYQVTNAEPNDKGEIFKRPGAPADDIPRPDAYPNDQAAAATFGKAPPDMNLLAKSLKYERGFPWFVFDALPGLEYQEMGADYIYAILNGYTKPDDPQWNLYLSGSQDRDAAADHGRSGQLHGRHGADAQELRQGRRGFSVLGGRAKPRRAQEGRPQGDDVPLRPGWSALLHQEADLGNGHH